MTVHIATSAELGRVVRRGLREPVRFVADNLLVGPCSAAAQAHGRARCDHWALRGRERTRFLATFREMLEAIELMGDFRGVGHYLHLHPGEPRPRRKGGYVRPAAELEPGEIAAKNSTCKQ